MWVSGVECRRCGSRSVQWRYKQPHCFLCGFNHPLERDNRKDGGDVGKAIVDIEMERKEEQ